MQVLSFQGEFQGEMSSWEEKTNTCDIKSRDDLASAK